MKNKIAVFAALVVIVSGTLGITAALKFFYKCAYPIDYVEYINEYSAKYSVDKALVYAVIHTESGFNKDALSHKEARGLMQITEETFNWAKLRMGDKRDISYSDIYNEQVNIEYGTYILSLLYREFDSTDNVLAAYHAGWGSVKKWLADAENSGKGADIIPKHNPGTREYVRRVNETLRMYKKLYG